MTDRRPRCSGFGSRTGAGGTCRVDSHFASRTRLSWLRSCFCFPPSPANQTSASAQAPGRSFCHCLPAGATIPRVSGAAETAGVGSGHPCCLAFEHEAAVPLDRKDYLSFSSPGQSQQEPHGLCCRNLERGKLWHEPVATLRQGVAGALPTPRSPGASLVSRPF